MEIAELRPLARRRQLTAEELVEQHRMPRVDYAQMRAEADKYFGGEDRVGDDDPLERVAIEVCEALRGELISDQCATGTETTTYQDTSPATDPDPATAAKSSRTLAARTRRGESRMSGPPLVFVNYRSVDEPAAAFALYRELAERFGADSVFRDADSLPLGRDFRPPLLDFVRRCAVLLVVIGENWSAGDHIHDPDDWVRREITEALEHRQSDTSACTVRRNVLSYHFRRSRIHHARSRARPTE